MHGPGGEPGRPCEHGTGRRTTATPRTLRSGQQREPDVLEPSHRRRDPRAQALVHGRQLRLRPARSGTLTINGALVQNFRGAVGTTSNGKIYTGYLKNYTYDDRLAYLLPPYLFDISTGGWEVDRETLCDPGRDAADGGC